MTIGKKIRISRKTRGMTRDHLAGVIGISGAAMSKVELDQLKGGPSPELVIKIADALCDDSILIYYIENNPVYQRILPKIFPDLNNIRIEPAVIFTRLAREAEECRDAADLMAEIFSNKDPTRVPMFEETFKAKMEQIVDVKRAVEILEFQLLAAAIIDKDWLDSIYRNQQQKCIDHGHHLPDQQEAV